MAEGGMCRVLVLNHFAAPRGYPGGTRHVELFSRLSGWQHLIVASDRNLLTGERVDSEPGFRTVRVVSHSSNGWRRVLSWLTYAWRATAVGLSLRRVDVVYASSPHLLTGLAGVLISAIRRRPLVLEVRDVWPRVLVDMGQLRERSVAYRALRALEILLYNRAGTIVIMAEGTRSHLEDAGVDSRKIAYIPNAADPADFTPSSAKTSLRRKYGFDRFTAIYAGAHGPANGLELLLAAAKELSDAPVDFVLVGGGVSKPSLMNDVASMGLTNVRFMDPVPKSEIPDLLHAADVGLHILADVKLFHNAVSPNKIFDYMAAGLPVLTNCPGLVSQLVHDAACGVAVEPGGIADGVRECLAWESARTQIGHRGRAWILQHQSRRAMSGRLAQTLATAVEMPDRRVAVDR